MTKLKGGFAEAVFPRRPCSACGHGEMCHDCVEWWTTAFQRAVRRVVERSSVGAESGMRRAID